MSQNTQNSIIDIQPILHNIGIILKNGMNKLIDEYKHIHISREFDKCKLEMEYYKSELEILQKKIENHSNLIITNSLSSDNILLNIEQVEPQIKCIINENCEYDNEIIYKNNEEVLSDNDSSDDESISEILENTTNINNNNIISEVSEE